MQDYNTYVMGMKHKVLYVSAAAAVIFAAGLLFYRNFVISLLFTPLALLYPGIKTRSIIKRRKRELNIQFKDLLYSLASSVSAGKTIESAFRTALEDLSVLYQEPSAYILAEIRNIVSRLDTNETLNQHYLNLQDELLENIDNFVNVLRSTKDQQQQPGSSEHLSDHQRQDRGRPERHAAGRARFEQKVLNAVPVFMITMLSFSAPEYMYPVFNTVVGRLTMTVALVLMGAAWFISSKVCDIKV